MHQKIYRRMMMTVSVALPLILAVGSFLGMPNDPELSGFFWLWVAMWAVYSIFAPKMDADEKKTEEIPVLPRPIFTGSSAARDTLDAMILKHAIKGYITVAEYKTIIGRTDIEATDEGYGWTDLKEVTERYLQGVGWVLLLPQLEKLKGEN